MADNTIVSLFGTDRKEGGDRHPDSLRAIDLAHERDFSIGPVSVLPSRRLIEGPSGMQTLEPKVMQVLVALYRANGVILSRDDLIARCWDGRIVGDASVNRVLSLLRASLRKVADDLVTVETVPRVGYRLIGPAEANDAGPEKPQAPGTRKNARRFVLPALLGVIVLLAAGAAFLIRQNAATPEMTIAMLPLEAGDGIDPLYAAGFEGEWRRQVARAQGIVVTTSETAREIGAQRANIGRIADAVGADRVLQGRLTRNGSRLILAASLHTADGAEEWSTNLGGTDREAGALPVRAARTMLRAIGHSPRSSPGEARLSQSDHALYLTAQGLVRTRDPDQLRAAEDILRNLADRNRDFSPAWSALAKAIFLDVSLGGADPVARTQQARSHAVRALELDANSVEALKVAGILAQDSETRFSHLERAVELDPGDSEGWLWLSHVSAHPDHAAREAQAMERLALLDPLWGLSWQAGHILAQKDGVAAAVQIDKAIAAAAAENWQADLAEARIANRAGDISRFHAAALNAMPAMTPGQRSITALQLSNMALLVDVPMPLPATPGVGGLVQDVSTGNLPARSRFERLGLAGADFWRVTPLLIGGPALFVKSGRAEELIEYFEAGFDEPGDFVSFSHTTIRPFHLQASIGTYVGLAYGQLGQRDAAAQMFDIAERAVARWRAADAMYLTPSMFEANLAAARGQDARALDALRQMIRLGYPYTIQSPGVALTGPMLEDPAWDDLRQDPRLVELLLPIRRNLAKERREILASSGS